MATLNDRFPMQETLQAALASLRTAVEVILTIGDDAPSMMPLIRLEVEDVFQDALKATKSTEDPAAPKETRHPKLQIFETMALSDTDSDFDPNLRLSAQKQKGEYEKLVEGYKEQHREDTTAAPLLTSPYTTVGRKTSKSVPVVPTSPLNHGTPSSMDFGDYVEQYSGQRSAKRFKIERPTPSKAKPVKSGGKGRKVKDKAKDRKTKK